MKKKLFLSLLAMGIICVNPVNAAEKTAGLPNPMVSYDSVMAAKNAAGFQPLYLPSISGYHVNKVWVIAGDIIDIEYVSDNQPVGKFRLRTARCTELRNDDISGIYGAKWRQEKIKGIETSITEVYGMNKKLTGYAAHWTHNNMLFSVSCENMTYREFGRLLANGLLELSLNYF